MDFKKIRKPEFAELLLALTIITVIIVLAILIGLKPNLF